MLGEPDDEDDEERQVKGTEFEQEKDLDNIPKEFGCGRVQVSPPEICERTWPFSEISKDDKNNMQIFVKRCQASQTAASGCCS